MFFVLATQNLVGALSTPEKRTRNYSLYSLGESIATVIGPVFVGFAIDAFRHPLTYLCLALYTAAWGIVLYANRGRIAHITSAAQNPGPRTMMDLLRIPGLRKVFLTNGIVMTGLDMFGLYMPVYARGLGVSSSAIGMILGAFGLAGFVTRLAIPMLTRRLGERRLLAAALAVAALAFVTFPLTTSPLLLAAAAFSLGLGLGCGQPLTMILAFNASPPGRSAEGNAMRLAVSYGTHVALPPAFGAIGSAFGLAPVFWAGAVLLGGGALLNCETFQGRGRKER